ncbi:MAG: alanine--glyoxylate aminotransferase family protein [Acidobacteria bacterium]|nr:alanine--glyoxylate aminotransferase family protein [Acidobacteriota bacterium]
MIKKRRLFTPGPTPLFGSAAIELSREIIHHRTEEFRKIFEDVRTGLKYYLQTEDEVLVLSCSGSGAMEAAVVNFFAPGETVAIINGGKFGERWLELARAFDLEVVEFFVERGRSADPDDVVSALKDRPDIKGLLWQDAETSTGARHPTQALAERLRDRDLLLVVDAITGLGAHQIETGAWGLDVVIGASQKGLGLPPGLSFLSMSQRAIARMSVSSRRKYYFDLGPELRAQARNDSVFTPSVSLIVAARAVLAEIRAMGLTELIRNAAVMAEMTRRAAQALGLGVFAAVPADSISAITTPAGKTSQEIIRPLKRDFGITFADGQAELKGKMFRITHLGYVDFVESLGAIAALELVMQGCGLPVTLGAGTGAASETYARLTREGSRNAVS